MTRTNYIQRLNSLILLGAVAIVCWVSFPPADDTHAANPYGENVTSPVRYIDACFKAAETANVIDGVAGKRFRIISLFIRSNSSTANNIYLSEEGSTDTVFGTNSTDTETLDQLGISGKAGWNSGPGPWYETQTVGKALQITLSAAEKVAVVGSYVEIN